MTGFVNRFSDDPNLLAERRAVNGQDSRALDQSLLVRLTVFLAHIAPVTLSVTLQVLRAVQNGGAGRPNLVALAAR